MFHANLGYDLIYFGTRLRELFVFNWVIKEADRTNDQRFFCNTAIIFAVYFNYRVRFLIFNLGGILTDF